MPTWRLRRPCTSSLLRVVSHHPIDARNRQLSVTEVLELRFIPDEGLSFDEALAPEWLDRAILADETDERLEYHASEPGRAQLEVQPLGAMASRPPIAVRGSVTVKLKTVCVRCLADVLGEARADLDLTLFPVDAQRAQALLAGPASAPAATPPTEAAGRSKKGQARRGRGRDDGALEDWSDLELPSLDALEEGSYDQRGVDLPALIREAMLLALDMNPTCEDEPACDARTAALLAEANRPFQEQESAGDPRWAALKGLMPGPGEPQG
jgi:uncharacterized metal-binding protein YceD (DUF177 family)